MTENNNDLPELIKNRIDMKKVTAATIYNFLESAHKDDILTDHNIMFYTTIGTVTGKWLPLDDGHGENEKGIEKFHEAVKKDSIKVIHDFKLDNPNIELINDTETIPLVNVTITPYGVSGPYKLDYFLLFTDQIVGVTFGKTDK